MKPFLNNMTQANTNPPGWITSIVLHVGVFFVLLNTPILKEYITPPLGFYGPSYPRRNLFNQTAQGYEAR